jgi:hypothetical protein
MQVVLADLVRRPDAVDIINHIVGQSRGGLKTFAARLTVW